MNHIEKYKSEDGLYRTIGLYRQNKFVIEFRADFWGVSVGFTVYRDGCGWVSTELSVLFFSVRISVLLPRRMRGGAIKMMHILRHIKIIG